MKKILFITVLSGVLLAGCNSSDFTINGTIEGTTIENVYLIAFNDANGDKDTLAVAAVTPEGTFTLTGKVEGVQLSLLQVDENNKIIEKNLRGKALKLKLAELFD